VQGVDLCVDACFSGDWKGLNNFNAFEVKKAYGIHPDLRVSEFDNLEFVERGIFERFLPEIEEYLISASAIGETGLDANIAPRVPLDLQRKVFDAQLKLAEKFKLPVIIHCAGMWGELLNTLRVWTLSDMVRTQRSKLSGDKGKTFLIHAARCSPEMVKEFEKIGGYFSFGQRELSMKKGLLCAESISEDRIMIESDGMSCREKISDTIDMLAKIRNKYAMEMSEITYRNFNKFYSK